VVAQDYPAAIHVAGQQGLDAFLEQGIAECRVGLDARQHGFLEVTCQSHDSPRRSFALPTGLRGLDVALLCRFFVPPAGRMTSTSPLRLKYTR